MTDRELLGDAAKAAGIGGGWQFVRGRDNPICYRDADGRAWNPLTDDGDALRLAVKLGFVVDTNGMMSRVGFPFVSYTAIEPHNSDPLAATRRAIVRAAVEIVRSMK